MLTESGVMFVCLFFFFFAVQLTFSLVRTKEEDKTGSNQLLARDPVLFKLA